MPSSRRPRGTFYFLRHGETDWNRLGLCVGQVDRELSDAGRRQALAAARVVEKLGISRVVHSPLSRAAETARIVSGNLSCAISSDEDLREACLGVREGMPECDPSDDFISRWIAGADIPGAERFEAVQARAVRAVERSARAAGGGATLLVSHWGVFAALSLRLCANLQDPAHCAVYRFMPVRGGWQISLPIS